MAEWRGKENAKADGRHSNEDTKKAMLTAFSSAVPPGVMERQVATFTGAIVPHLGFWIIACPRRTSAKTGTRGPRPDRETERL